MTDLFEELKTSEKGLSDGEALKRLTLNGKNVLASKKKVSIFKMILEQLTDKMIIILFVAAFLSFILGETAEGVVILIIIVINAVISIIQEKKAADAVLALKNMNAPMANVIRDGEMKVIPTQRSTVGDMVYLEAGGIVPGRY